MVDVGQTPDDGPPSVASHWRAMQAADLDAVVWLEQSAHSHPWSRGNFSDSLQAGYAASVYTTAIDRPLDPPQKLNERGEPCALVGHWVVMPGFEECHLLNITVARNFRREGWASRMMLDILQWAIENKRPRIWLEVRQSNDAARALYQRMGFTEVAVRKGYYPSGALSREDAIVMCWEAT